jgi:hypothetical protein
MVGRLNNLGWVLLDLVGGVALAAALRRIRKTASQYEPWDRVSLCAGIALLALGLLTARLVVLCAILVAAGTAAVLAGILLTLGGNIRGMAKRASPKARGYASQPLAWPELFERYSGFTFLERRGFKIPHVELFSFPEGLTEAQARATVDRDSAGNPVEYRNPVPEELSRRVIDLWGRKYHDNRVARVASLKVSKHKNGPRLDIVLQTGWYSQYLVSNLLCDTYVPELGTTVRAFMEKDAPAQSVNPGLAANPGGVTVVAQTADRRLLLVKNRGTNATAPHKICASTSGTIDLRHLSDGKAAPFDAIRDEIYEELHVEQIHIKDLRLLGVTRDMSRNGIAEFQFFAQLSITEAEVRRYYTKANKELSKQVLETTRELLPSVEPDALVFERKLWEEEGFSLSGLAAVFYAEQYIRSRTETFA